VDDAGHEHIGWSDITVRWLLRSESYGIQVRIEDVGPIRSVNELRHSLFGRGHRVAMFSSSI
jgi:hypothetical protein